MGGRTTLKDFVSSLATAEPSREKVTALIGAIGRTGRIESMQLLAWLLLEALAPETRSELGGVVREAWAPTEGELARLLRIGGGHGLPSLLWLIGRSEQASVLLERLLDLTEQTGFTVPSSGALEKLAVAPAAALRAERRRKLRQSFPVLF